MMTHGALRETGTAEQMPIAIDARLAGSAVTGVGSYRRALREALAGTGAALLDIVDGSAGRFGIPSSRIDAVRRWLAAGSSHPRILDRTRGTLSRPDIFRLAHVHFRRTGRVLRLRAPGTSGIVHWTYPIPAVVDGWINLHTLHDVIPLTRPELCTIDPVAMRAQIIAVAAASDRIVTVSEWARRSILETLPFLGTRVVDCGSAVADLVPAGAPLPEGLVKDRYLLFCGLIEPRKNLVRVVRAWHASDCGLPFVVAGPDGADGPALRAHLSEIGATVLPYQPRGRLIDLIVGARAVILASLEEGFGLPIAEAMALGTPTIATKGRATAEVAGGAALLVDPLDSAEIGAAINRLATDDDLALRLAASGLERAKAFTPHAFAERLRALHRDVIAERESVA